MPNTRHASRRRGLSHATHPGDPEEEHQDLQTEHDPADQLADGDEKDLPSLSSRPDLVDMLHQSEGVDNPQGGSQNLPEQPDQFLDSARPLSPTLNPQTETTTTIPRIHLPARNRLVRDRIPTVLPSRCSPVAEEGGEIQDDPAEPHIQASAPSDQHSPSVIILSHPNLGKRPRPPSPEPVTTQAIPVYSLTQADMDAMLQNHRATILEEFKEAQRSMGKFQIPVRYDQPCQGECIYAGYIPEQEAAPCTATSAQIIGFQPTHRGTIPLERGSPQLRVLPPLLTGSFPNKSVTRNNELLPTKRALTPSSRNFLTTCYLRPF